MSYIPFSKRNGYVTADDCIIRESLPEPIMNAIHNCFTDLFTEYNIWPLYHENINADFGRNYLHCRTQNNQHKLFSPLKYVDCDELEWYERIDIFEWTFQYLFQHLADDYIQSLRECISNLNQQLELLHFAYRVVDGLFIEVTSATEISVIEEALVSPIDNAKTHLLQAIRLISPSQTTPDYRNCIKESISAVEAYCRYLTNESTLDRAIPKLQLHPQIRQSIFDLYCYTNDKKSGARHAWMDQTNPPTHDEAIFLLVSSCCFINYLVKLQSKSIK